MLPRGQYFSPFCHWTVFCCIYVYHTFIHASVNLSCLDLGCFHVLVIVTSAAVITGLHGSFQVTVLSGYMSRSGMAWSYGWYDMDDMDHMGWQLVSLALLTQPSRAVVTWMRGVVAFCLFFCCLFCFAWVLKGGKKIQHRSMFWEETPLRVECIDTEEEEKWKEGKY